MSLSPTYPLSICLDLVVLQLYYDQFSVSIFLNSLYIFTLFLPLLSCRLLKFSYLDTYELSVTLPYPIFDKKGVAKFDKSAKTLTVTMPVQPPVQPNTSSDSLSPHISDIGNNNVGGNIDGVVDEEKEKEREKKIGEEKKKNNSRWVGDDSADSREESRRRSEELKREIEARVEESKLMPAPANPTSTSSATVTVDISHSTTSAHSPSSSSTSSASAIASKDFIPSGTFLGRKEGFLFQNGVQGQGYYIDRGGLPAPPPSAPASQSKASSSSSTSATSSSSSSSAAAATAAAVVSPSKGMATDAPKTKGTSSTSALPTQTSSPSPRICRYDYKQTKQAVAVLIHVPHILLNTARVSFLDRTVNVLFEAADCGPDWTTGTRTVHSTETECVHVNPIISGSPTTARITSDNTFINSSVTAAGSKSITAEIIGNNRESVSYGFQLISTGILEKSQCKYDIASQNMVIVLTKKEEGYWEESDQSKILSLVSLPEGTSLRIHFFYFTLFCLVIFCSTLFCFVSFYSTLIFFNLFNFFYSILLCHNLFFFLTFSPILFLFFNFISIYFIVNPIL